MVTSSPGHGSLSPPMPSLSLSWSKCWLSALLSQFTPEIPGTPHLPGKVMGCLCHHFGQEDRHACFGLPRGNPPTPGALAPGAAGPLAKWGRYGLGVGMAILDSSSGEA